MTRRRSEGSSTRRRKGWTCVPIWTAVATVLLSASVLSEPALACAVCYGADDAAMTAGMNNAILMLLGVVVVVQGSFVALFLSFRHRARRTRGRGEEPQPTNGGTS